MNKCSAVPLAFGAAFAALLCLARRQRPGPATDAQLRNQLRQIHEDLFLQRRLSVYSRRVLNDAHRLIHGYENPRKTPLVNPTKSMAGSPRSGRSKRCGLRYS